MHVHDVVRTHRRTLIGAFVLALAALVGGMIWATSAGANEPNEPATGADKTAVKVSSAQQSDGPASVSTLRGPQIAFGTGKATGSSRVAEIGGGDEIIASLSGSLVPVAVDSKDGALVAYSSWRQLARIKLNAPGQGLRTGQPVGRPSIRVYDGAAGTDRLVETGAYSPALSLDGRLAFVKGDADIVRASKAYTGQVVVGSPRSGGYAAWTTKSARYFPYAWAGSTLLVYKALPGSEVTDLYGYTGPGKSHLIASQAFVIAISPDGSRVLVTVDRRMVEIVRVSDGAIEASMPLDGVVEGDMSSPTTPHYLMYSGSWRGDRVVANSDKGLVVLNVAKGIAFERILVTPKFKHGVVEPRFVDDAKVIGWADLADREHSMGKSEPAWDHALVTCDLVSASCSVGEARPARSWTRWITNPSR